MPAQIERYNAGRLSEPSPSPQVVQTEPVPDLTVQWQGYVLTARQFPDATTPQEAIPGLYRDSFGDTWCKAGDGTVHRIGWKEGTSGSSWSNEDPLPPGTDINAIDPEKFPYGVYPLDGSYKNLPSGCPNPVQGII